MTTTTITDPDTPPDDFNPPPDLQSEINEAPDTIKSDTGNRKAIGLQVMQKQRGGKREGAGRKRKITQVAATPIHQREVPSHSLKLPAPPKAYFTKPLEFFTYWASITDPALCDRINVYVYRQYPVCDLRMYDKPGGRKSPTNIAKIEGKCPFEPEDWKYGVLREWGSGTYKMMFNEGPVNRCQCVEIAVRDSEYPAVLDYKYLCVDDPTNTDFVRWARSTGRLKSDGEQREDEDMAATNESTRILSETVERLVDKVTEQQQQPVPMPVPVPVSENSRAAIASIDMMKGTMETMMGMIKANQPTNNPIEDATKLIDIAKALAPAPAATSEDNATLRMMERMMEESNKRAEEAQRRADKMEERFNTLMLAQHAPVQPPAPKSLIEQITELKGVRESLGDLFGGGESRTTDSDDNPKSKSTFDRIVEILPKVMDAGAVISQNAARMFAANQQPQRPPQPVTYVQQPQGGYTPNPGLPPGMQPKPETQAAPVIHQPDQQQPQPQQQTIDPALAPYFAFLDQIKPAFLHHLKEQLGGDVFAEWLVNSREDGKLIYAQITDGGIENIIGLLKQYPPIWDVASMIPQRFAKFMDDFMDYGKDEPEDNEPAA